MLRRLILPLLLALSLGLALAGCSSSSDAPSAVTVNVTIKGGQVDPNGTTVNVRKGGTVTVNVTSDVADEVHVHGIDKELAVEPNKPATMTFTTPDRGVFEMESHGLEKLIVKFAVR